MSPDLSVVICTFNRATMLRRALATAAQQQTAEFSYEVVVIDDGSSDNTRAVVEEIAASTDIPVRYVREDSKAGIAVARNRGVTEARGAWIVFFDDDQLADPDWLVSLMRVARAQDAKIVGGARKLEIPEPQLASLGAVCRSILGESLYPGAPEVLRGKDLPTTGNLLLSRAVFDAVGLFDVRLTSSGEDADLITRARAAAFEVWTAPQAMVAHMIPPYRLEARYFRWVSLRWGNQFAYFDAKEGKARVLTRAVARAGQALLVHVPRRLRARLTGNAAAALDAQCLLWRAQGYVRTAALLLAPGVFPQKHFLSELEFRLERELFTRYAAAQHEQDVQP